MDAHFAALFLQSAAAGAAAGRLIWLKLGRRFPALLAFLVFLAVCDFSLGFVPLTSRLYYRMYLGCVPVYCITSIFAVRELFALTFEDYPGIRTGGRWVMYSALVLATGISLAVAIPDVMRERGREANRLLIYSEIIQRSIVFALAVLIIFIVFFLSRYPLNLRRNTYISSAFFSALFLSEGAQLLIDSFQPRLNNLYIDFAQTAFAAICLGAWAQLLQPETGASRPRSTFATAQADHLIEQLQSLNQVLSRASRW